MARKRMFDIEIVNQDSFLDLPMEAKALYFLLGMEADDEGFVNPRKVLRLYGGNYDSVGLLVAKGYLIPFKSGVVVITDWKRNNYLDRNRITATIYQEEKKLLTYNENTEKYECLTNVKQMLNQYSIEEYRREESSIEENKYSPAEQNDIDENEPKVEVLNEQQVIIHKVIDYLNEKTGSKYKYTTRKTNDLIKARLNEKFTLEQFYKVIDTKTRDWINDTKFSKYLRPETLFGNKFESYLNQPQKKLTTKDLANSFDFSGF